MIELVNVEKTYHTSSGDIHALKRTSLTINQGEIFGIIGFQAQANPHLSAALTCWKCLPPGRFL